MLPELRTLIYSQWATNNLRLFCEENKINYVKLITFLTTQRAIIWGPVAHTCFGYRYPGSVFLCIFIYNTSNRRCIDYLNDLVPIVRRYPEEAMGTSRLCCNKFRFVDSEKIYMAGEEKMKVLIGNPDLSISQFLRYTSIIDYFGIAFDGINWITLQPITDMLETGVGNLLSNEGHGLTYFSQRSIFTSLISNPWPQYCPDFLTDMIPSEVRETFTQYTTLYSNFVGQATSILAKINIDSKGVFSSTDSFCENLISHLRFKCEDSFRKYLGAELSQPSHDQIFWHIILFISQGFIISNLSQLSQWKNIPIEIM